VKVGVLALQGAFAAHIDVLHSLDVAAFEVRTPQQLADADALVIPGGESTTMSMMAERSGLLEPLAEAVADGRCVLGTCAGAILLSSEILDGRADQRCLGAIDISVRRNAYGRQVESFEADLDIAELGPPPFRAVCIRAPRIEAVGEGVEVWASLDGSPALVRSGAVVVATFHPELSGDPRLHDRFLQLSAGAG
jgi:5'-phosphate synthase pdxT subunit